MSLWLDFMGAEIRYVETASYGKTRIAEAGKGNKETILFLHGVGGHCEAYAKNVVALSDEFHVIAYDYVGQGMSDKPLLDGQPRHRQSPPLRRINGRLGVWLIYH